MTEGKAEKLLSEVSPGDFPTEAVHDDKTGMYTIPDSEPGKLDAEKMVQLPSGLWIEKPNQKEIRVLTVHVGSTLYQFECEESFEELIALIDDARTSNIKGSWLNLTEPIFGFRIAVPVSALLNPVSIITQLRDLEAMADQMKQYETQKRLNHIQQASKDRSSQIIEQYKRRN